MSLPFTNDETELQWLLPPKDYFWRWAENQTVIEWSNGTTVCYTEDLISLLKPLQPHGFPPLGGILLIMAACREDWLNATGSTSILHDLLQKFNQQGETISQHTLIRAIAYLDKIRQLPEALRKGENRVTLLMETFAGFGQKERVTHSKFLLEELISGRSGNYPQYSPLEPAEVFKKDIEALAGAQEHFSSLHKLESRLRTGLDEAPEPLDLDIPEPDPRPKELLELLLEDNKTEGVATLTHHIIAALNIPMHSHGSSEQPLGGFSDITNRGDYDRLLISELAYDDDTLMARLANNEALFLRRETPPAKIEKERVLLIDNTLKMWGKLRPFSVAAALACALDKHLDQPVQAHLLTRKEAIEVDLSSPKGVVGALGKLDAGLHCGVGLESYFSNEKKQDNREIILIISENAFNSDGFQQLFQTQKANIQFLLLLDPEGILKFFQVYEGRKRLFKRVKFDLDKLLFPDDGSDNKISKVAPEGFPAIFGMERFPLRLPTAKKGSSARFSYYHEALGLIGVSLKDQLLHWTSNSKGAIEVLSFIEDGKYFFGVDPEEEYLGILVYRNRPKSLPLYHYNIKTQEITKTSMRPKTSRFTAANYKNGFFYLEEREGPQAEPSAIQVHPGTGEIIDTHKSDIVNIPDKNYLNSNYRDPTKISSYFPYTFKIIKNINFLSINLERQIVMDKRKIQLNERGTLQIAKNRGHRNSLVTAQPSKLSQPKVYPNFELQGFTFNCGTIFFLDPRGFLHLKSWDTSLPEVSLVLITGMELSGWASDGTFTGRNYFFDEHYPENWESHSFFYAKYIQPIIDNIKL